LNDTWKPVLIGIGEITYFSVYNRWGDLLFESSDPTIGWDGTYQADEQEIGNYIVMVKGLDGFGQPLTKSAMVLLMR
ncbi:MAG TPA: gliding motility-associated C-terminal domain-containing protein, partial [Chitinophagales bacterium]|nr:gliding motility-associated C-terminal domain-containing protein [Chitinophagales bacterium]HNJ88768.1 gliding motility-associated C-terminal domain-containing protein [Chitinophagales bacterium]